MPMMGIPGVYYGMIMCKSIYDTAICCELNIEFNFVGYVVHT